MDASTHSFAFTGVVPAVCDAEAGESRFPAPQIRSAMADRAEQEEDRADAAGTQR